MDRMNHENQPSHLLSNEENKALFSLLGERCITLATAVIQLLTTDAPLHSNWTKRVTGVVCFVRDAKKRGYFIRVYDIDFRKQCVWEQEIYTTFEYKTPRQYFHTFEAHDCMAGLNFADETEANLFRIAVNNKLRCREQRKTGGKKQSNGGHLQPILSSNNSSCNTSVFQKNNKRNEKEKAEKVKFKKEDIGHPSGFRHVTHFGFDTNADSDKMNTVRGLQDFLKLANVNGNHLSDSQTRHFIYDFINTNGGVNKAIEEARCHLHTPQSSNPPPLPPSNRTPYNQPPESSSTPLLQVSFSPPMQTLVSPALPLSRPLQTPMPQQLPPPPPIPQQLPPSPPMPQQLPPPPPMPQQLPPSPPMPQQLPPSLPLPLPPSPPLPMETSMPQQLHPPPPPPLPLQTSMPQQLPPSPPMLPLVPTPPSIPPMSVTIQTPSETNIGVKQMAPKSGERSLLLEQIRIGKELNHVVLETDSVKRKRSNCDSRDALLAQIKEGVTLKSVETNAERPMRACSDGIAGALAKALEMRSRAIHETDDSNSSSDEDEIDDEEWDD